MFTNWPKIHLQKFITNKLIKKNMN